MKKIRENEQKRESTAVATRGVRRGGIDALWIKRIITAALCFALAFAVGGCAGFPGTYPFGIAVVAASSGLIATVAAMAGALLGSARIPVVGGAYAMIITVLTVCRMVASVYLSYERLPGEITDKKERLRLWAKLKRQLMQSPAAAIQTAAETGGGLSGIMLRENIWIRLALSGAAALLAGAWSVVEGGYAYYDLFGAVFSLMTTPIATYLYYAALQRNMRTSSMRECGVYFLLATACLSLHAISADTTSSVVAGAVRPIFDLGALFAFLVATAFSMSFGTHRGTIAALICGMTMNPAYAPSYALGGLVCGSLSKRSRTFGILTGGLAASVWAVYVGGLEGMTVVFAPVVVGCAVMIPLSKYNKIKIPDFVFGESLGRRAEACSMAELSAEEMKRRISKMSEGMIAVSEVLTSLSEKLSRPDRGEFSDIVEDTFEAYCATCRLREKCRGGKSSGTEGVKRAMTEQLASGEAVSAAVIPGSLASMCFNMGRILDEINLRSARKIAEMKQNNKLAVTADDYTLAGELIKKAEDEGFSVSVVDDELTGKLRRQLSYNNFHASSVAAYGDRMKYIFARDVDLGEMKMGGDDIQTLIEGICGLKMSPPEFQLDGAVLSMRIHSVPAYECISGTDYIAASDVQMYWSDKRGRDANCNEPSEEIAEWGVGESSRRKAAGEVSGDTISSFEAEGKFYMIISDGMGSGREAALTSGVCAGLLRKLISAGASLETSLKMLNGIIRSGGRECSATVDIAEIDRMTGEARFIKSGAAPSFVLRDGSIFRLQSKTVPIGIIRALDAEMIKFDIQPGDSVIMVSDGISRSYDETPWLLDLMTEDDVITSGDPCLAARKIVSEAALRGASDDITAGVIRII